MLRVSGDCEGPHAGSHSENLSTSRNFDARGSYALRGCQRNLLVRRLTRCIAFNAVLTWLRLCGPSIGTTTMRVTFGIAQNAAPVFRRWSPFLTIPTLSCCAAIILGFAQQLRQLGNIRRVTIPQYCGSHDPILAKLLGRGGRVRFHRARNRDRSSGLVMVACIGGIDLADCG